jgi:hypothetical protein
MDKKEGHRDFGPVKRLEPFEGPGCGATVWPWGLALLLAFAGPPAGRADSVAESSPALVCEAPVFEFGATNSDTTVSHVFVLRNAGGETVAIHRVRPGCGCTSAVLSTNRIAPGADARLEVAFNLRGRNGLQRKGVTVESNDPRQPHLRLELAGTVGADSSSPHQGKDDFRESVSMIGDLAVSPAVLNVFASETNRFSPRVFTVSSRSGQAFQVLAVMLPSPEGRARIEPPAGARQRVIIEYLPASVDLNGRDFELKTDQNPDDVIRIPIRVQPGT